MIRAGLTGARTFAARMIHGIYVKIFLWFIFASGIVNGAVLLALGRPIGFFDRSVDNHISNLRKKLGTYVRHVERFQNVRGTGYVYTGEIAEEP
jgi:hypothetical protein